MYHLVYTSHATHAFSESDLIALLKEAREFNRKSNITGMLLYIQGKFIQVLEGQKEEVTKLFNRIAADPRHHRVAVIVEGESHERIFKDWSMGFRRLTEQEVIHLGGFRDIDHFFARKRITEESNLLFVFLKLFYNQNMVEFQEV
jgi:hypothetical protein